eukprot:8471573-Pyramimonas_sp.AAC.1
MLQERSSWTKYSDARSMKKYPVMSAAHSMVASRRVAVPWANKYSRSHRDMRGVAGSFRIALPPQRRSPSIVVQSRHRSEVTSPKPAR